MAAMIRHQGHICEVVNLPRLPEEPQIKSVFKAFGFFLRHLKYFDQLDFSPIKVKVRRGIVSFRKIHKNDF